VTLNKTPSLVAFESQVKKVTRSKHQKELNLMADILNTYIDGFNLIDSFTFTEDNEVESAWLFLVTRNFHSMRCAIQLMLMGYYGQALSLLRTVTEDWFICHDCKSNPKTTQAVLYNKYKIPNRKLGLTYYQMAKRAGKLRVYEQDYRHQSKFTHSSALSLGILRDPKTNEMRAAPSYDNILFLDCCELFFRNALGMTEFMELFLSKLSEDKVTSWRKASVQKIQETAKWLTELREKYGGKNA